MIAFAVCPGERLANAQVLHAGLRRHHPDVPFYLFLGDHPGGAEPDSLPFPCLTRADLGLPDPGGREQAPCGGVVPLAFSWLFNRHPGEVVVAIDPAAAVISPLTELAALLDEGADCVLTPGRCEPEEFDEAGEDRLFDGGVYDLGLCALRDTEEVRRIVFWWWRRLRRPPRREAAGEGRAAQRWADVFPAFIEKTRVLRHPGYNVGRRNLSQRTVRRPASGWTVNDRPLRLFTFAGLLAGDARPDAPLEVPPFSGDPRDARELLREYEAELGSFGRADAGMPPHLPLLRADSLGDYLGQAGALAETLARRRGVEAALVPGRRTEFSVEGFCAACGADTALACRVEAAGEGPSDAPRPPNWREQLVCVRCGLPNRARAVLHLLRQEIAPEPDARIYLTEMVTPLYRWLKARYPLLEGSEYLGAGPQEGARARGLRHEDVQDLSFDDASFDLVLSFDVLEHVPDASRALGELARVLRPGGRLVCTVPFRTARFEHEERVASAGDGTLDFKLPPEYHGDPMNPDRGALCYRHFGWRVLDDLRRAGLARPQAWLYWSRRFGYLGETNAVLVARRSS